MPKHHARLSRLGLAAVLAMPAIGCGMGLPLEERIDSTRPLAIRVEIVDPSVGPADPVRVEGLPLDTARLVPFFVDQQGPLTPDAIAGQVEPRWLYCPLQPAEGLFACLGSRLPLRPEEIPDCPAVDLSGLGPDLDPNTIEVPPAPCWITGGTPAQPELTIPLDPTFVLGGDIEVTMIGHAPGSGVTTQVCLERLLGQSNEVPDDCLFIAQRVPVGPDGDLLALAQMLGIAIEGLAPIPDEIPEPDTHPRIQSFTARVFDDNDTELGVFTLERGDTITAAAGNRIELETIASETDLQTYLIPVDMTSYDERTEAYDGRWFRTWGELLSPSSNDPLSINTWTMVQGEQDEDELPPDGTATMYYTLRDGRDGIDWFWFNVTVEP